MSPPSHDCAPPPQLPPFPFLAPFPPFPPFPPLPPFLPRSWGDLVCLAGMENVEPGDTIVAEEDTPPLSRIEVDEPTLCMMFSVSTGPFSGLDGKYVTSRHIRDRLLKEMRGNVSIKIEETEEPKQEPNMQ